MQNDTLLSKPVILELNLLLSVHGALKIERSGSLHFEPGFDAKLLGRQPMDLKLSQIRGVRRMDGGRRVVVDADEPVILRGAAALQAYVILGAILDAQKGENPVEPAFMGATIHGRLWKQPGMVAVGRTGLGFGVGEESIISGAMSTTWIQFNNLEKLLLAFPGIHIFAAGEELVLECEEPLLLRDLMVERWFTSASGAVRGASWSCLAARKNNLDMVLGHLVVNLKGLCFVSADEEIQEVLIPRRRAGIMAVEEPTLVNPGQSRTERELLLLGTDERHLVEVQVQDPQGAVAALDVLLSDAAWFPPGDHVSPEMEPILGPSAYTSVWRGHELLASRRKVAVAPFNGKMSLKLDYVSDPPAVPCGVRVEVANGRGRYMLTGVLTEWQAPDPRRTRGRTSSERTLIITLENEIQPANRRQFYRLPLKDKLLLVQLQSPPKAGRVTLPPPIDIDEVVLLDLSRTGATLWLPRRPGTDMAIQFQLAIETRAHPKPAHPNEEKEEDEPEITVESYHLVGRVIHLVEMIRGKSSGWRVGIEFPGDTGHEAFDARQRAFLRHRAEERDERGGM